MGEINFFYRKKKDIFKYQPWLIQKSSTKKLEIILVEKWRYVKYKILCKLKGIKNRDEIVYLKNYEIFFHEKRLPNLNVGEYYWKDILECIVFDISKNYLGIVKDIIETGSNDVLVIINENKEILIPFLKNRIIKNVNIKRKEIFVNWDVNF